MGALFFCILGNWGMKPLHLQPGRERRILKGHRWVFSNEIAERISEYQPGSLVEVFSSKGVPLGVGYINPRSLILVRLVSPPGQEPERAYFRDRIRDADALRRNLLYPDSLCYRAVYGESDGLPGLVVDRYEDVLVTQVSTLGMALMETTLREILIELFEPRAVVFRNDTQARALEGLPFEKGIAYGNFPNPFSVRIDGIEYSLDPLRGQKTGFYLDQRDNRAALRRWVQGKRILDLFCYNGAWSMTAALAGAAEVTGVDESPDAIAQAGDNARRNGVLSKCEFIQEEVFTYLKGVRRGSFDVVVVDPPAFAKTKSALQEARKGYTDLNRRAMIALEPGGILVTSSCSYHVTHEMFEDILLQAALACGRRLKLLEVRGQAMDHPILLSMPETRYLKCCILQVGQM